MYPVARLLSDLFHKSTSVRQMAAGNGCWALLHMDQVVQKPVKMRKQEKSLFGLQIQHSQLHVIYQLLSNYGPYFISILAQLTSHPIFGFPPFHL